MPLPHISKTRARILGLPDNHIQTILIKKNLSLSKSKKWLKKHNFINDYVRQTTNFYRFQQNPIINGGEYYTIDATPDIRLVFQKY